MESIPSFASYFSAIFTAFVPDMFIVVFTSFFVIKCGIFEYLYPADVKLRVKKCVSVPETTEKSDCYNTK